MFTASYSSPTLQAGAYVGYVPTGWFQIGRGDYLDFSFCCDCGTIQNFTTIPHKTIAEVFNGGSED